MISGADENNNNKKDPTDLGYTSKKIKQIYPLIQNAVGNLAIIKITLYVSALIRKTCKMKKH